MTRKRRHVLILSLAAIGLVLTACGSGRSSGREVAGAMKQSSPEHHAVAVAARTDEGAPTVGKAVPCKTARAWLGRSPGAIDFAVDCLARARGEVVGFTVGRESRGPHLHSRDAHLSGITGFRGDPPVTGPGREGRRGSCRRVTGGNQVERSRVFCEAAAKGSIRIHGRLWVEAGSRCGKLVVISTSGDPGCRKGAEACLAGISLARLADDVPRGCH